MSRRKQLRPFKVQDDDDDSNANQIKNADNGLSTASNGHNNTTEPHASSKFDWIHLLYLFLASGNCTIVLGLFPSKIIWNRSKLTKNSDNLVEFNVFWFVIVFLLMKFFWIANIFVQNIKNHLFDIFLVQKSIKL